MDEIYSQAFSEVLEVLENSERTIVNKIPATFMTFLNQNKDKNYVVTIDFNNPNWEETIKPEAQAILALIYRDYIVSKDQREILLTEEREEQTRFEKELREKYNPDNIFKKRNSITTQENIENNAKLIETKKEPWYKKIFNQFKKILGIKN